MLADRGERAWVDSRRKGAMGSTAVLWGFEDWLKVAFVRLNVTCSLTVTCRG